MRKIKFRGLTKVTKKFVYGYLWKASDEVFFIRGENNGSGTPDFEIIPESAGQYTGLKDKNGKEIYEDDVVKIILITDSSEVIEEVIFEDGCFTAGAFYLEREEIEVIGNIYENPELLNDDAKRSK